MSEQELWEAALVPVEIELRRLRESEAKAWDIARELAAALDAKDELLACYRLGKQPPESLWRRLDKAEPALSRYREAIGGPKCKTCRGKGLCGGHGQLGMEDRGDGCVPCPDCEAIGG